MSWWQWCVGVAEFLAAAGLTDYLAYPDKRRVRAAKRAQRAQQLREHAVVVQAGKPTPMVWHDTIRGVDRRINLPAVPDKHEAAALCIACQNYREVYFRPSPNVPYLCAVCRSIIPREQQDMLYRKAEAELKGQFASAPTCANCGHPPHERHRCSYPDPTCGATKLTCGCWDGPPPAPQSWHIDHERKMVVFDKPPSKPLVLGSLYGRIKADAVMLNYTHRNI